MATETDAKNEADRYPDLPEDERDRIADDWGDVIYSCVECDESCRESAEYATCPRHPAGHDESGYMGTGTDYPEDVRRLARHIAAD